jgi:hypothetical protein
MTEYNQAAEEMLKAENKLIETMHQLVLSNGLDYDAILSSEDLQQAMANALVLINQFRNA